MIRILSSLLLLARLLRVLEARPFEQITLFQPDVEAISESDSEFNVLHHLSGEMR